MSDIENIITELERQRAAIDNALEALRGITRQTTSKRPGRPKGSKRVKSADGRQRQIEAMRRYWAAKRAKR